MSDQNSPRLFLNLGAEVSGWEIQRRERDVVLYLRQAADRGHVAVTFTVAQAHEIGKLLIIPDLRARVE
jgi:hypothetical protein